MDWIKTSEKLPQIGQKIEMTCKHWEINWVGDFSNIYIDEGTFDEFGNFWDHEGARLHDPMFWRPYQPERSKREDIKWFGMKAEFKQDGLCYFENGTVIDPSQIIDDAVL